MRKLFSGSSKSVQDEARNGIISLSRGMALVVHSVGDMANIHSLSPNQLSQVSGGFLEGAAQSLVGGSAQIPAGSAGMGDALGGVSNWWANAKAETKNWVGGLTDNLIPRGGIPGGLNVTGGSR